MAIAFQYNKTSLQAMQQQLRVRLRALPTLKSKEAALRAEAQKAQQAAQHTLEALEEQLRRHAPMAQLWEEFPPHLARLGRVTTAERKIAGVAAPVLVDFDIELEAFSWFGMPGWLLDGVDILKELLRLRLEYDYQLRAAQLLDHARRKTTQKVNLYEKVQIPGYEDAIRKIKRFLEDEDNLAKAAQKLVKKRLENDKTAAL